MKFGSNVLQVNMRHMIDGVGFSIWRHTFKTAAITSFHATKCCYLVCENEAYPAPMEQSVSSWAIAHSYLFASKRHYYYYYY